MCDSGEKLLPLLGKMPKPKTKPKPKPKVVYKNARRNHREEAARELNGVAASLSGRPAVPPIQLRSPGAIVANLHNTLLTDTRVLLEDQAKVEAAGQKFLANGGDGDFSVRNAAVSSQLEASAACSQGSCGEPSNQIDGKACEVPTEPLTHHRELDLPKEFRLRGKAFMLTYNSLLFGDASAPWEVAFNEFVEFLEALRKGFKFKMWTAKMERSLSSTDEGRVHIHAYLAWSGEGLDTTDLTPLAFKGVRPRIDVNREHRGYGKRQARRSLHELNGFSFCFPFLFVLPKPFPASFSYSFFMLFLRVHPMGFPILLCRDGE